MLGDANVGGILDVVGASSFGAELSIQGDTAVQGKFSVASASDFGDEVAVNGVARFAARTHHLNGVALTEDVSFSGMIKQNNRLEFFLDGTLRFYVDTTGGHNA